MISYLKTAFHLQTSKSAVLLNKCWWAFWEGEADTAQERGAARFSQGYLLRYTKSHHLNSSDSTPALHFIPYNCFPPFQVEGRLEKGKINLFPTPPPYFSSRLPPSPLLWGKPPDVLGGSGCSICSFSHFFQFSPENPTLSAS